MFRCTKNSTLNRKISTCYFYFVRRAAFFRAYFATKPLLLHQKARGLCRVLEPPGLCYYLESDGAAPTFRPAWPVACHGV